MKVRLVLILMASTALAHASPSGLPGENPQKKRKIERQENPVALFSLLGEHQAIVGSYLPHGEMLDFFRLSRELKSVRNEFLRKSEFFRSRKNILIINLMESDLTENELRDRLSSDDSLLSAVNGFILNASHVSLLQYMPQGVQHLEIMGEMNETLERQFDEFIVRFKELKVLDLTETGKTNVRFLSELPQLISLDLTSNPVRDLSPVADLKNLELLAVGDTEFKSTDFPKECSKLRYFYAASTGFTNLNLLERCEQLEHLFLGVSNTEGFPDPSPLSRLNLPHLKVLRLSECDDFSFLLAHPQLTDLLLDGSLFEKADLRFLRQCTQLKRLSLVDCEISLLDYLLSDVFDANPNCHVILEDEDLGFNAPINRDT